MKKLKPKNFGITFCEHAASERRQCATCARNVERYDMGHTGFHSFFYGPRKGSRSQCPYHILDARKPEEAEQ